MWRPQANSEAIEIRRLWSALPDTLTHVDAVYEDEHNQIAFFIGRDIYVFKGTDFLYQSSLSDIGIDHHFDKIDAIFKWHKNELTYIFSGDQYWRLDGEQVSHRYPKDILRSWHEVYDIDTAYSDGEELYFFKEKAFFVLDPRTMRIDRMKPQSSAQKFMQCPMGRVMFKTRFNEDEDKHPDVIDILDESIEELPDEDDNIELEEIGRTAAKTKNTSHAVGHYLLAPLLLASLVISRAFPSIFLYF